MLRLDTIHEQVHMLLMEALEGEYLDPEQTLYVNLDERMAGIEEDSMAEACYAWDTMTVEDFLNAVVAHHVSEYGGDQAEIPCFETLCESVVMW